ncbi:RNA polymerase, sigma-24 subunit, ECF subfamily [Fibrisoma limi BUZ 3]|uniref:RNA polymerase, sigma-24 subunit, ECF subfamily n=1 Tax=Fibrisoma limi BUZ 3 TaxID=1185876 RepID=I2GBG3_9BACT|nr:sigma-70 family RNA polymerase sigma factor [Fibrisoma limi]CCH51237.1 RNA polymerase, sigma-24 subunit, ECF subfamily [Fibrisoma limi BUZ 3]
MGFKDQAVAQTDLLLWQQMKQGNELAFGKLIKKYANFLQNYGYKFIRDEAFIKDCVQEVFIEIWNRRDQISTPESVRAYLLSSVRKRVIRQSYRQRISKDDEPALSESDLTMTDFSPEWFIMEQESLVEMTQRVTEILNQLPKRQREVIYLRFYQNLDREEIAQIMGVHLQSVSNLLQSAFKSFREYWTGFWLLLSWYEIMR